METREITKGVPNKYDVYAMITKDILEDSDITAVCMAILAYSLGNTHRVVGRAEIMSRFKIGKTTYYESLLILENKGYCVKVDSVNYKKGTFGFTTIGHYFYKYPINSLKWMEVYGDESEQKIALKTMYKSMEKLGLNHDQVSSMRDTIVGLMKDTNVPNEGHYSGSNEGHTIHSIDNKKKRDYDFLQNLEKENIAKSDMESIPKSDWNTTRMYESMQDARGVSNARIVKKKKERSVTEETLKNYKDQFKTMHGAYLGVKGDMDDHYKKFCNKLKTSTKIETDLQEFETGLKNYMAYCEKNNTEQKYITHFKNFIHHLAWRNHQVSAVAPKPKATESITAENAEQMRVQW